MHEHTLRRKDRALGQEETLALLQRADYGVLATTDADGAPYGVPLSYVWRNGALYFHSALTGHKVENIRADGRATFTVVGDREPVYDKGFSTWYESAIVSGVVSEVTDADERYAALYALAEKYLPDHIEQADGYIRDLFKATLVCVLRPEAISGKSKRKN